MAYGAGVPVYGMEGLMGTEDGTWAKGDLQLSTCTGFSAGSQILPSSSLIPAPGVPPAQDGITRSPTGFAAVVRDTPVPSPYLDVKVTTRVRKPLPNQPPLLGT